MVVCFVNACSTSALEEIRESYVLLEGFFFIKNG